MSKPKRVLMALSGGIDSAAAAKLLIEQGYLLTGVTLDLHANNAQAIAQARAVCDKLAITHQVIRLRKAFKKMVIDRYVADYAKGLTPNPCMVCNQAIKFGLLYDLMLKGDYDYLATGHYALKKTLAGVNYIAKAPTRRRDQSYFLYHLSSEMIGRLLFPVGHFTEKAAANRVAAPLDLAIEITPESVGACFIDTKTYDDWLAKQIAAGAGDFVDQSGHTIASHDGFYKYTIGQKRGLPAIVGKGDCVLAIDAKTKCVVIGPEDYCYSKRLVLDSCNLTAQFSEGNIYDIKIFNWGYLLKGKVKKLTDDTVAVCFQQPIRAVALGQYAVFYQSDLLVGGGRIIAKDNVNKNKWLLE